MKLRNVSIAKQLSVGLGFILLLSGLLAALAWWQNAALWQSAKHLFEHPLNVRRALSELRSDVLHMQLDLKDLCLAESETSFASLIHDMDRRERDAFRQLEIIRSRYLGPAEDVALAKQEFQRWRPIREATIRALSEGKRAEAVTRVMSMGVDSVHVETVMAHLQTISDFAVKKGDQIIQEAEKLHDSMKHKLVAALVVILLLSMLAGGLLLHGIRSPLAELTAATTQFRGGKLDVRVHNVSGNEFGALASSFNAMADAIRKEMQAKESAAQLASAMLRTDEAHAFCRDLLKGLLAHTDSQLGAVYLLNAAKSDYVHFESIGLDEACHTPFSATKLTGGMGAAVATRRIQRITETITDIRFSSAAASGELVPRELLAIPVVSDDDVCALVWLGRVHAFSETALRLVDDVWTVLAARMNGVLAFRRIHDLAGRLEEQNRELSEQKRELTIQSSELVEQNTELEQQKRQIAEANRLKSVFVSNMSHELRTPLNSVIALSSVLHRRLAGKIPAEEYGYLDVIERNGKSLLELINDILDLSRIEAGREEVNLQKFSMGGVIEELLPVLRPLAMAKALGLEHHVPADLPPIVSDADKCRHILQNLLGNAIKFTVQGRVSVAANLVGDMLEIMVSDTGIGIAEDKRSVIFQEFRQADETTSRKYGGSGLGLSIARKYARMLGGDLTVQSVLGQGATFTLRLPLTAPASQAPGMAARPCRPSGAGPSGHGQCILVVEDSTPAIIQITDILKADGYCVEVARDGKDALEYLGRSLPDAVVLDLAMPAVDGFEVLRQLRGSPRTAKLPVLVLTARQVSREELGVLTGNHIHQLIEKGDVDKGRLLAAVAEMVAPMCSSPVARAPTRRRGSARDGKPVILVVEDNPDSLRALKALLEPHHQVVEAHDGREGVEQARRLEPDVVLMDIALPEMDGIAAFGEIRRDEALRDITVFAVTASAMSGDREKILAHGFDGYISKPIDPDSLLRMLRQALGE
jgi:signal transduction histidine kinase/CheY-like chemotaxis protein/HAMP domain-containing protein